LDLEWSTICEGAVTEGEFEQAPWKHGEEVASYEYHDAEGAHVYTVRRYEYPEHGWKTFRPYLPGKRRAGLGEQERVLYRLPKVIEQADDGGTVFVVEGEKDVHSLEKHGLIATTSGSTNSWEDQYSDRLAGAGVVVIPDNDEPGMDYAEDVAEGCHEEAKWVRIVELDDVPTDGGDVTDWFARGHDKGELESLIRSTDKWEPDDDTGEEVEAASTFDPPSEQPDHFWFYDSDAGRYKVDRTAFIEFLDVHGFGKLYAESDLNSMLVRVEDNIVRHTSREKIKDFVLEYVREVQPKREAQVIDALLRGANVYFSDALFEFLSPVEPDFHEDTPEKAFFYYENGFVEVTADGFQLRPYSELDGVIWEDQIIDREFEDLTDEAPSGWDWHEHLLNVAGHDRERHNAICTALGYLMHGYKDPAVTKAIIFMDEKVTDVEEGRTGKSVTTKALQHMGSTLRVDGRNFSFDSRFAFQEVTLDTAVVDFNDAKKRFPFERLFSLITDDFPVERKGKDRVTIPFEDSPKFALSTNYVIEGKGASFEDRTFQVEFADYYSPRHSPKDEFGHRLFDNWDTVEWARFDNIMVACVRQYLRDGLVSYDHVNVQEKKLRQETCPDFAEWILEFVEIEMGRRYDKKGLKKSFQEAYAPDYEDLTGYQCTTWLKTFARIYDLDVSEPKSGSTRYIVFRDTSDE
jgi:hypothetical protein